MAEEVEPVEMELVERVVRAVRAEEDGEVIFMSTMRDIHQTMAESRIQRTSLGAWR